jgi:hypothetical protein
MKAGELDKAGREGEWFIDSQFIIAFTATG